MPPQFFISLAKPATQKVGEKDDSGQRNQRQADGKLAQKAFFVLALLLPILNKFFFFRRQHKKNPARFWRNGK